MPDSTVPIPRWDKAIGSKTLQWVMRWVGRREDQQLSSPLAGSREWGTPTALTV